MNNSKRRILLRRFWTASRGFWKVGTRNGAWLWTCAVVIEISAQVFIQYRINVWNRTVFNALEQKQAAEVLTQALIFVPLALASILVAVAVVQSKTKLERLWRRWLTRSVVNRWLDKGHYFQLDLIKGDHANAEYRMTEDLRLATELPVEFVSGVLMAFLSAVTFIGVLWSVGGAITVPIGGNEITIPAYLVIAAMFYAIIASVSMVFIGRGYVVASEDKSQGEAELRYLFTRLRENGESIALIAGEEEEKNGIEHALGKVIRRWRRLAHQYMKTTSVAQVSYLIGPILPLLLCAPKYLWGQMTLGDVMQATSAFMIVQTAFSWLVDNYPKFADWTAAAHRFSSLLVSLDALEKDEREGSFGRIQRGETKDGLAMRLRNVSVTLDDGTIVVKDADVQIRPGERVLFVGESGSGKSTLVRAITGVWPWGEGEILIQHDAKTFLMPQKPYIPLGPLRRATIYPLGAEEVRDEDVKKALQAVGMEDFVERFDKDEPWDRTLSGGEKQRVAFARLLIHKPDIVIMDEATASLDNDTEQHLMRLALDTLPKATFVSVGHREELEAFHDRKIMLEYRKGGAKIVADEVLPNDSHRQRLFGRWFGRRSKPNNAKRAA